MVPSWREELESLTEQLRTDLEPRERAEIELEVGIRTSCAGNHDDALLHLRTARKLFEAGADQRGMGRADAELGAACVARSQGDRARVHLDRALATADEVGDPDLKARALSRLAEQAHREMELERARELWARARSHFEQYWDGASFARANAGLGMISAALGETAAATPLVSRAVEDAIAAGHPYALGRARMAQAAVFWHAGDGKQARRCFRRAITLFQREDFRRELGEAYLRFGLFIGEAGAHTGPGVSDPPAYWLAKAQAIFRELGGLRDLERVREAFHTYGRRATDQVEEQAVHRLLDEVKRKRFAIQRESQRLADLTSDTVDQAMHDVAPEAAPRLSEATARIQATERTLSRSFDDMAMAEDRFLHAVNNVVLERANIQNLLELNRALTLIDDHSRLPSEIAKMAAELVGAQRALVAVFRDPARISLAGYHGIEPAESEVWQQLLADAASRGGHAALMTQRPDTAPATKLAEHGESPLPAPEVSDPAPSSGPHDSDEARGRDHDRQEADQIRLGQAMIVPLRRAEDLFGLVYTDRTPSGGVFTQRDLDLLAVFADQAAVTLENSRIQEELRLAARSARATLQAIDDGVVSFDSQGVITSVNAAGAAATGVDPDARPAPRLSQMPHLDFLRPVLRRGEELNGRSVSLPNGDFLCSTRVVQSDRGEIAGVVATFTELKRASSLAQRIVGSTARYSFADIIGDSANLKRRLELAEAAARSDSSTLITGESGTGKELFAQAIHNAGPRASGPFVGLNCAAIPRDLLESELFGYETGAFTGARRGGRPGKFELAEGGTILLDEIGDMPLEMQAKLLRVLQERVAQRLGGTREIPLSCRVITTTNRDLGLEVQRGLFRQDLFYRLRVIHIELPPLRERPQDIARLTEHFLRLFSARLGKQLRAIHPRVMEAIMAYPWPGNIRELEHVLEAEINLVTDDATSLTEIPVMIEQGLRANQHGHSSGTMAMSTGIGGDTGRYPAVPAPLGYGNGPPPSPPRPPMAPAYLGPQEPTPPILNAPGHPNAPPLKSMSESERELLVAALIAHRGNIPSVARALGVSRGTVYNKMKKFQIDPSAYRG